MVNIYNPKQVILVSVSGKSEVLGIKHEIDDIIIVKWHSPANENPGIYSIFVPKYEERALELIRQGKTFVVNFIGENLKEKVEKISNSGIHEDAFQDSGLGKHPCEKIDSVRIYEAVGWLECEVTREEDLGDHIMFLGKVLYSELLDGATKRLFEE